MCFLCDNLEAQNIIFEQCLRPLLARVGYMKCLMFIETVHVVSAHFTKSLYYLKYVSTRKFCPNIENILLEFSNNYSF